MTSHFAETAPPWQALYLHLHIAVLRALHQHRHGGKVAHAVGHYVPLLVVGEPV